MSEDMNLSIMGQSKVPPGFRFHPTEEELLHYYLRKKVACQNIDLDVIRDVDLNKLEPWDIQEKCKIGSTPQDDWYFFSHKDKKYPTGTRTNRATAAGFWKATGRDKVIRNSLRRIGMRKTLVFYTGRAPHGQKSDWIMHEYRLDDDTTNNNGLNISGEEEGWVVCRVFRKKNYLMNKSLHHHHVSPSDSTSILCPNEKLQRHHQHMLTAYIGQSPPASAYKQDQVVGFSHLLGLESPIMNPSSESSTAVETCNFKTTVGKPRRDWVELERLVASQLGGQPSKQLSYFSSCGDDRDLSFPLDRDDDEVLYMEQAGGKNNNSQAAAAKVSSSETGFWSFGHESSSLSSLCSDPLCHLSV